MNLEKANARKELLEIYFNRVCDKSDWKGPIKGFCRVEDKEIIADAIEFFTATQACFFDTGVSGWLMIDAVGYRNGPAGP